MATIIKTPAGTFRAIIRTNNKAITKTFKLKKLATAWAKRIEGDADLMAATGMKGASVPFSKLADEFHDQWTKKDNITSKIKFWKAQLGDTPLIKIDDIMIDAMLKEYAAGDVLCGRNHKSLGRQRAPATVSRMRAMISSIFVYAIKQKKYLKINPVKTAISFKEPNGRERYLSDEERSALLSACRASDWNKLYLLTLLALTTGARQGELLGLHWDEINFKDRTALLFDTKNGESRILTFPDVAMVELQQFREVGTGLVFQSKKKWNRPFEFRKHWHKAMDNAGIKNFRFHDLRHSAASYLAMSGATLKEIAEVLGHKSIQSTDRYAHLSVAHRQKLTDRVLGKLEGLK